MKIVKLATGHLAVVDEEDYQRVVAAGPWYAIKIRKNKIFAVQRKPDGNNVTMHRFIMGVTESWRKVEHFSGCGLDNRRINLSLRGETLTPERSRARFNEFVLPEIEAKSA